MRKLLSMAGTWIGEAARTLLKRNDVSEAAADPIEENLLPTICEWDYRPKKGSRRSAFALSTGMEPADLVTDDKCDNAGLDEPWLEFESHTLVNLDSVDPTAADEAIEPSMPGPESAALAYDQSLIDSKGVVAG